MNLVQVSEFEEGGANYAYGSYSGQAPYPQGPYGYDDLTSMNKDYCIIDWALIMLVILNLLHHSTEEECECDHLCRSRAT